MIQVTISKKQFDHQFNSSMETLKRLTNDSNKIDIIIVLKELELLKKFLENG